MPADNPYSTTDTEAGPEVVRSAMDVAPEVVSALKASRPWMLVIAIIACALGALTTFGGLVGSAAGAFGELGDDSNLILGVMAGYAFFGVVTMIPGVTLIRAASAIGNVHPENGTPALVEALRRQKVFWLSIVIAAAATILAYAILMVVMVASFASKGAGG